MLDVHPPHAPTHSWKDFFIHVGTICVGLLIAVGLEQTVEAIHRGHQRAELLESLRSDTVICEEDGRNMARYSQAMDIWLLDREQEINLALWSGQPATDIPVPPHHPTSPVWLSYTHFQAAKASGSLQLLSTEDVDAFSDVNFDVELALESEKDLTGARAARLVFEAEFRDPDFKRFNLSKASPADLREYLKLLANERRANSSERHEGDQAAGAAAAVLRGERGIRKLQKAEDDAIASDFGPAQQQAPAPAPPSSYQ